MRKATLSATETQTAAVGSEGLHRRKTPEVLGLTLGAVRLRLLFSLLLLELHVPIMQHCSRQLVDGDLLFDGEAQDVRGHLWMRDAALKTGWRAPLRAGRQTASHVCGQQLLFVVDARHGDLTLADHGEVVRVGGDEEHLCGGQKGFQLQSSTPS